MFQQQVRIINAFLMAVDAFCVILAGYGAFFFRQQIMGARMNLSSEMFIGMIVFVMVINNYAMASQYLYTDRKPSSFTELLLPVFKAVTVSFAFLSTAIVLFKEVHYSRAFLLVFAFLSYFFIIGLRVIINAYFLRKSKSGFNMHRILIAGSPERAKVVSKIFEKQLSWGHEVIGRLSITAETTEYSDCIGSLEKFPEILRHNEIDEVVFAFDSDKSIDLSYYLHLCRRMGIQVRILPSLWKEEDTSLSFEHCQKVPFMTIKVGNINATGLFYKRATDIVGGLIGTILFLIMYPFIGAAIKLESKGPVIFKQKRAGQHGRTFNLYKFRSMYHDAEARKTELVGKNQMNGAIFKLQNDPRITCVGRFLRKTSLDEFPQFFNVLRGEMSLVGTRPPTVDEVESYLPDHLKRLSSKPGITGLWQVSGRNQIKDFDKIVELDCRYLENWRFSDDLKIIFKTIYVVLKRKGAI